MACLLTWCWLSWQAPPAAKGKKVQQEEEKKESKEGRSKEIRAVGKQARTRAREREQGKRKLYKPSQTKQKQTHEAERASDLTTRGAGAATATMGSTRMLASAPILGSAMARCRPVSSTMQRRFSIMRKGRAGCQQQLQHVGKSRPCCSARPESEQSDRIAAAQEAVTSALVRVRALLLRKEERKRSRKRLLFLPPPAPFDTQSWPPQLYRQCTPLCRPSPAR